MQGIALCRRAMAQVVRGDAVYQIASDAELLQGSRMSVHPVSLADIRSAQVALADVVLRTPVLENP